MFDSPPPEREQLRHLVLLLRRVADALDGGDVDTDGAVWVTGRVDADTWNELHARRSRPVDSFGQPGKRIVVTPEQLAAARAKGPPTFEPFGVLSLLSPAGIWHALGDITDEADFTQCGIEFVGAGWNDKTVRPVGVCDECAAKVPTAAAE